MPTTMKFLLFICLLLPFHPFAQSAGKVIEGQTITSKILGKPVRYSVYLPADYDHSERMYPVVYLLHGYTDNDSGWLQFGEVNRYADQGIAEGTLPPMIIIMPDAGVSWYINSYDGAVKYEDFFIQEFMPQIEKTWRIKAEKQFRGVAGLSMGGYGTLIYALKYPELFAAAAPLSAAVSDDESMRTMDDNTWAQIFGPLFGRKLSGTDRLTAAWYANSPLKMIEEKPLESLRQVRYWIDCGDDDFLTIGNSQLHIALTRKGVPHEFRVRDGAHTWTYWRTGITDALQFIGDSFRRK